MSLRGHYKVAAGIEATARFLIIRYGSRYYALPSEGVRGVRTREEAGVGQPVAWVGTTYHDIDLAGLLSTELDTKSREIRTVLYSNDHSRGAIRVDEVIGLVEVPRQECRPLPPQFRGEERAWIPGTIMYQDHLALILNPEWVLGELGELVSIGSDGPPQIDAGSRSRAGGTC